MEQISIESVCDWASGKECICKCICKWSHFWLSHEKCALFDYVIHHLIWPNTNINWSIHEQNYVMTNVCIINCLGKKQIFYRFREWANSWDVIKLMNEYFYQLITNKVCVCDIYRDASSNEMISINFFLHSAEKIWIWTLDSKNLAFWLVIGHGRFFTPNLIKVIQKIASISFSHFGNDKTQ